jgi:hypothetical protein
MTEKEIIDTIKRDRQRMSTDEARKRSAKMWEWIMDDSGESYSTEDRERSEDLDDKDAGGFNG